jgi:hypothetical protein
MSVIHSSSHEGLPRPSNSTLVSYKLPASWVSKNSEGEYVRKISARLLASVALRFWCKRTSKQAVLKASLAALVLYLCATF